MNHFYIDIELLNLKFFIFLQRELKCNKCCHEFIVKGEFEEFYIIHPPPQCPNPTINCKSTTFQPVEKKNPLFRRDYQEIKLQEPLHKLSVGAVPQSVWVTLDDDLTSLCKPGKFFFNINVCLL